MGNKKPVKDHLGNEFSSLAAMCRAYPVGDADVFYMRQKKHGMSLEDALMLPVGINKRKSTDHLENEFPSRKKMCEHYGIPVTLFVTRTEKLGWDLEKALTTPPHATEWIPVEGPDGKMYENVAQMCKELGISRSAYDRRKDRENQLDDTINMRTVHSCSDGMGNEFPSISAMCKYYNISRDLYYHRVDDLGMDTATALTLPYTPSLIKAVNRIGEEHVSNNGCRYKIVDAKTDKDVTVEFIDGMRVKVCYSVNVAKGIIKHPTLKKVGTGSFVGFTTKSAFTDDTGVYYICECQACGFRDILTPDQMFEHYKNHKASQ